MVLQKFMENRIKPVLVQKFLKNCASFLVNFLLRIKRDNDVEENQRRNIRNEIFNKSNEYYSGKCKVITIDLVREKKEYPI